MELDDAVYRHVIVEAPVTFQGTPKPLHYLENRDRFAPWKDKIVHVVADLDGCEDHWAREHASRDAIPQGLDGLGNGDIFLLSDVDEIPQADILQDTPGYGLIMRNHALAVNLLEPCWLIGTMATTGDPSMIIRQFRNRQNLPPERTTRNKVGFPVIAGWNFPWLGGPGAMRAKVHSFSHPEGAPFIDANADYMYRNRVNPSTGGHMMVVTIDETWPKFMRERRGPANWYLSQNDITHERLHK